MNLLQSKIISIISTVLLLVSVILTLIILFTSAINDAIPQIEGGDIGTNIGRGCTTAIIVFFIIFALLAQIFAFLLTLLSIFPVKRKGLVFASNSFSIVFCILAFLLYLTSYFSFIKLCDNSSAANFVQTCLIFGFSVDVIGVIVCIASMVIKGKVKNVKSMEQEDLPPPFVVGGNTSQNDEEIE